MRASIGTVRGTAACLLFTSACGGTLFLGDNEDGGTASAGRGAQSGSGGVPVDLGVSSAGSAAGASAESRTTRARRPRMRTTRASRRASRASRAMAPCPLGTRGRRPAARCDSAYTMYDPHNCGTCGSRLPRRGVRRRRLCAAARRRSRVGSHRPRQRRGRRDQRVLAERGILQFPRCARGKPGDRAAHEVREERLQQHPDGPCNGPHRRS